MGRLQITKHLADLVNTRRILGHSTLRVSEDLKIPQRTVAALFKKQRENIPICGSRRGRPRKTTIRTDRAIALSSKINRFRTASQLGIQYKVSRYTVQRRLSEQHIRSCIAVKEDVTTAHKIARVQWCRDHKNENFQFWIFSDESSFELRDLSVPQRQFVHRSSREKYSRCCVTAMKTQSPKS